MLTPQQIADKWARNAAAAGPAITAGVQAMVEADNPLVKAAAAQDRWLAGVQAAAAANKFQTGLQRVSFADWKQAMLQKGVANYQNGIAGGKPKMLRFLNAFIPYVTSVKGSLPPRGTLQQNIQRMTLMVNGLAQFRQAQPGMNLFGQ